MKRTLLSLLLLGCGDTLPRAGEAPVLGHVRTRNGTLTIVSSAAGPRYTVRDGRGRLVSADLSEAELSARHPALFERIRKGHALDASLERPVAEETKY